MISIGSVNIEQGLQLIFNGSKSTHARVSVSWVVENTKINLVNENVSCLCVCFKTEMIRKHVSILTFRHSRNLRT